MMRHTFLLFLSGLLINTAAASTGTTSDGDLSGTAVGWSGVGGDLSGIPQGIAGIWTGRSNWNDLGAVGWPASLPAFMTFIQTNPNGAVNYATALIPHGMPSTTWNGMLDEVVSGAHDSVFVTEGQNMAKYSNKTVYCRPWWEMTLDVSNLDPTKFKAAWNHAVPIMRAAFMAAAPTKTFKVAFCYLPNTGHDPKTYFPGPTNVDVIDADIYGKVWSSTTPTQNAMLASVTDDLNDLVAFAATYNKPMGVSEWANMAIRPQGTTTNQGRGDDPEYIDMMLSFAAQHHFLYMVYFNISNWGVYQTFADTPLSLARFRAALTAKPSTSTLAKPASTSSVSAATFSSWQASYFTPAEQADPAVSGPMADPYGSGIPNLIAYAFQMNPATATQADVPQATPTNGHLQMSYQVPSVLTDVNFVPEVSSDLHTWDSGATAVQVVSNVVGPNGTTITVADCLPTTIAKHYMRLRVVQQ